MAEAEGAHPWDGQGARARHEDGATAPAWQDHRDRTGSEGPAPTPPPAGRQGRGHRPGSDGEHALQQWLGTTERAERFYDEQVLDHLNERMREFVQRQEMFFLATADRRGECDSSFRAGPAGFLQVLDEHTLAYPEYRGNGVHASLGNIQENPHLGIMLIDFARARIGLHINGRARIVGDEEIRESHPHLPEEPVPGRRAQVWVRVEVEEAYIHCAKHIPQLQKAPKRTARDWGTDDYKRKGGDFFGTARDARERRAGQELPARDRDLPVPSAAAAEFARAQSDSRSEGPRSGAARPEAPRPGPLPGLDARSALPDGEFGASTVGSHMQQLAALEQPGHAPAEALRGHAPAAQRQLPELSPSPPPPPSLPALPAGASAFPGAPGSTGEAGFRAAPADGPAPAPSRSPSRATPVAPGTTAADGASGAMGARAAPAPVPGGTGPADWRQAAEHALAEAKRRGSAREQGGYQGWFG